MADHCCKHGTKTIETKSSVGGNDEDLVAAHVRLNTFVDTEICLSIGWLFPTYRCVSAVYFAGWLMGSFISFSLTNNGSGKWFVFLTHWSFVVLVVQSVCLAMLVIEHRTMIAKRNRRRDIEEGRRVQEESPDRTRLNLVAKVAWIADNVSSTMAIGVTISYWAFVYDGRRPVSAVTIHTHGVNAVYVLFDVCLCDRPRHLIHVYQPILFGVVYVMFSWIYWTAGGTDPSGRRFIYSFLDWTRPAQTLKSAALFAVLLVAILYAAIWSIHRTRRLCLLRCRRDAIRSSRSRRENTVFLKKPDTTQV